MSKQHARARLSRIDEKQNLKKAYFLMALTVIILGSLAIFGLPLLIKAATLIEELRSSNETVTKKDSVPPQTPLLEPYASFTNSPKVDFYGKTEAGVAVIAKISDGMDLETVSDAEGKFSFTVNLREGENKIDFLAKDVANNESGTESVTIVFDDLPPEVEITNPSGLTSTTEENKIQIIGKTEADALVYLNERRAIVDHEGNFQSLYYLQDGENKIELVVRDRAGNETKAEITVRYERF